MATTAYNTWVRRGRPWSKAQPIVDIEAWARAHRIPILGTIGNNEHLKSSRPEDHTPFSFTAWPDPLPGYIVTAIDLGDTGDLADDILIAARAGLAPWLKYANLGGRHYSTHDRFRSSTASSDDHVHLSMRTDYLNSRVPLDWLDRTPTLPPKPSEPRPAPGPDVAFPLQAGHYFGYDDGTTWSHSGSHDRRTAGKRDSEWLQIWAAQLVKRGWSVGKGRTWLPRFGNDGRFGDEYGALVGAYQADQGLRQDRKLGAGTWNSAFDRPVT